MTWLALLLLFIVAAPCIVQAEPPAAPAASDAAKAAPKTPEQPGLEMTLGGQTVHRAPFSTSGRMAARPC
jgi:biopolymer transport protein ExbD